MAIDIKEVDRLAKLSRLYFTDEEKQTFIKEFDAILDQVQTLDSVNVDNVDLRTSGNVLPSTQLSQDVVGASLSQDNVILNAPQKSQGAFLVPITVEEEGQK
ncbi:MAG: Asp-tRNA(Asn)/Glu-tRNA(Gln) amidotransferase subunit GatC [Clostridia bacterium]|nr:Asp-tRNA(Asn)/Glu-tRNA(Gln) amidotransferase subunit GatC [Clostridia bacterium]